MIQFSIQNNSIYTIHFSISTYFQSQNSSIPNYSRDVMVKAMDCGILVSRFVLQSHYYVHFQANTLGKDMNPLILPAMG